MDTPPPLPLSAGILAECLAELTSRQDELALIQQFFALLNKLWPNHEHWLVKTPWDTYPTESNLIVLGDQATLPRDLAVYALQLRSREAFLQETVEGRHFILAHIARPDEDVEDLFALASPAPLSADDQHLLRNLLRLYRNLLRLIHAGELDLLTGVLSRKHLLDHLTDQLTARLHGRRFHDEDNADHFAVISLDQFSLINAQLGHMAGDYLLQLAAAAIKSCLHVDDSVFRLNGKSFGALIRDISTLRVQALCDQIRQKIAEQECGSARITASIGLTSMRDCQLPQDAIDAAWEALNYAKAHGRNQVCDYQTLLEANLVAAPANEKAIELF